MIPSVVQQHVDESIGLHDSRRGLIAASNVQVFHLRRADDRLAAHLDGLKVAGDHALPMYEAALESPSVSAVFVAAVRALEDRRADWLDRLLVLTGSLPELRGGLVSAFSWLEREQLRGVVAELLSAEDPGRRLTGIAASAVHRVDPGIVPARRLEDPDPSARARGIRSAGELGLRALVSAVARAVDDEDPACEFWAAWSAVLLGDRENALGRLATLAFDATPYQARAFRLALLAANVEQAHSYLQSHAAAPDNVRMRVKGAGYVGDPRYVPWLIGHMADDKLARVAGESFTMITGLDLSRPPFEAERPENFESGPSEDPEDDDVAMDEDDDLPWPDQAKVQSWWNANGARFTTGVRHFMGAPPDRAHCIEVLRNGYQRQRIAAACHLCLLSPGTPLFEWRAPARRQQRQLAQMT
jgi:uncharacterized protein (TIGR02270 family)